MGHNFKIGGGGMLLRAFADDATLQRATQELEALKYRTHEFGDSVFMERKAPVEDLLAE